MDKTLLRSLSLNHSLLLLLWVIQVHFKLTPSLTEDLYIRPVSGHSATQDLYIRPHTNEIPKSSVVLVGLNKLNLVIENLGLALIYKMLLTR